MMFSLYVIHAKPTKLIIHNKLLTSNTINFIFINEPLMSVENVFKTKKLNIFA